MAVTRGRRTKLAMKLFDATVGDQDVLDLIQNISDNTTDQVYTILMFVRSDILTFLRSYTNVMNPPRYQRKFVLKDSVRLRVAANDLTGYRPAHPGGWSDVTYDLRDRYYARVEWAGDGWQLIIGNRSAHAVYVEARDGLFVVEGVLGPRGPVSQSIAKALKALGLDWKIVGPGGSAINMLQDVLQVNPKSGKPMAPTPGFDV